MPLPAFPDRERLRALARRRGTGLVLALVCEALILLMLLTFTPKLPGKRDQGSLLTFGIEADKPAEKSEKQKQQKRETKTEKRAEQKPQPPQPTPTPTPEPPIELPPNIIKMTRQDFASTDVTRFSKAPSAAAASAQDQGEPDSAVVGKGPRGEPMYAAEWYRRPTDAELNTYITDRVRQRMPGAGLIRCRTVENFRVDDCNSVAENPVGSGLSEAVRQAAWQFRVRPPRVGGKPMIGTWVLIEIDYTITRARPGEPSNRP